MYLDDCIVYASDEDQFLTRLKEVFVSKSFNATQSRWSTIQKEAYAIFHCCQQMDTLLRD